MAVAIDAATGRAFVLSQATANERVSVLDTVGRRVVQTIEWAWGLKPTSGLPSPNAVAIDGRSGRVFVTDANTGSINVLDMWNGRVLRRVAASWSPNAVAVDGQTARVFIVGGRVTMLDARTGAPLREIPIGGDAVAIDARAARVLIADNGGGAVHILDAASGAIVRTVGVGGAPTAIAVDMQSSRAFVTNMAGNTVSMLDTRGGRVLRTIAVQAAPFGGDRQPDQSGFRRGPGLRRP